MARVLVHIDGRTREFEQRLMLLEQRARDDGAPLEDMRAIAEALHAEIRRTRAATSLLELDLQVRRQQLSELRAATAHSVPTTMEAW